MPFSQERIVAGARRFPFSCFSSFIIVLVHSAKLFSFVVASDRIQVLGTPGPFRQCNVNEFKWTVGGPSWTINARVYNHMTGDQYPLVTMMTQNNNSFKVAVNAPTDYSFHMIIKDAANPQLLGAEMIFAIHETTVSCDADTPGVDIVIRQPPSSSPEQKRGVNPAILISVGVVLFVAVVLGGGLFWFLRRRRRRRRKIIRASDRKAGSVSGRFKGSRKSTDFLLEGRSTPKRDEGLAVGESTSELSVINSRVLPQPHQPPSPLELNVISPNASMPSVIPSSKELRMRGMYTRPSTAPAGEGYAPSISMGSEISGETFRTDTVSVWPTQSGGNLSESATERSDERSGRSGGTRARRAPPPLPSNPESLSAIIGHELQQIIQEQEQEQSPNGARSGALLSPVSGANAVDQNPIAVNPATSPIIPVASSSGKQRQLTLAIPSTPILAGRLPSASPRTGSPRVPIRRRDMEMLTDMVAQRLARSRRGDYHDAPPPSYS